MRNNPLRRRGQGTPASPDPLAYARAHVTSAGAHALLDEVERGRQRRDAAAGSQPAPSAPQGYTAAPGAFEALPLDRYLAWLRAYLAAGGKITHFFDYPYPEGRLLLATRDFTTGGECGACSRDILVPAGIRHLGGGLGHCNLYFEADGKARARAEARSSPLVGAWADPCFQNLPGCKEARQRQLQARADHEQQMQALQSEAAARARVSDLSAHIQPRSGRPGPGQDPGSPRGETAPGETWQAPGPEEAGVTWCIACQAMVPYPDWPRHSDHSDAALRRAREQRGHDSTAGPDLE